MDIKFINQPKELKMGEILKKRLQEKYDEAWLVSGIVKDSGIEYLMEDLETAIKNNMIINLLLGVDRKNTSKDILLKIISIGANLSVHVNREEDKVETRVYAFFNENGDSYAYFCGGKLSEGGLVENQCLITEIRYSKNEKEELKCFKNQLAQGTFNAFKTVDSEDIILLAKTGEILSRIIDRKIPTISELYGDKEQTIGEQIYDESSNIKLFDVNDLENIDIEFESGIELRNNVELEVEKEAKKDILKTTKTEKDLKRLLGKEEEEKENKKVKIIKDIKGLDTKNITTLLIEAGKIANSGADEGKVKIPKMISTLLYEFLEISESAEKEIKIEILDNKDGKSYETKAIVSSNVKGISIYSKEISKLNLDESDIIRILKENENKFKFEIIRKETNEYMVWERYCVNSIRGTARRYGIE